MSLKISSRS